MAGDRVRGIGELIREGERSVSFEFFPPKDEAGEEQLWRAISALEPATTPATVSLCPPIYFDAECSTRSTPWVIGFWKIGVAQELSVTVVMP